MKRIIPLLLIFTLMFCGCKNEVPKSNVEITSSIILTDSGITVDGNPISNDSTSAVYCANDIVFYLENQGFTYGEGEKQDEHSQAEADSHNVVHITKPGTYEISGKLSLGQIAVDLGEDAENDPNAVVTLYLNGISINCDVAPAVIFYNVYECGSKDEEAATESVDTSKAGANVIIADGSENNINGSYVARIYKSYELNEEGTEVVDSKKLHKYDGAFYSKMSMNINGEAENSGILNITADNEGLDSELHLTINGGNINITSGNDGINTNEDNISVTTINGGNLNINITGTTGEGDGIDSNGWLVINGGCVTAWACSKSADAGIDSDKGIHLNGGAVYAGGNMLDRIEGENINYAVFTFSVRQSGGKTYSLRNEEEKILFACEPANDFTYLIIANETLKEGDYTFWCGETQLEANAQQNMMQGGMHGERPDIPADMQEMPSGEFTPPEKPNADFRPDEMMPPNEDFSMPEGIEPPPMGQMPQNRPGNPMIDENMPIPEKEFNGGNMNSPGEMSKIFSIKQGGNYFSFVSKAQ